MPNILSNVKESYKKIRRLEMISQATHTKHTTYLLGFKSHGAISLWDF